MIRNLYFFTTPSPPPKKNISIENQEKEFNRGLFFRFQVLYKDQVSRLGPRFGVQLEDKEKEGKDAAEVSRPDSGQIAEETMGHDVPRDNVLERAIREEHLRDSPGAPDGKEIQEVASPPTTPVKDLKKVISPEITLRTQDDIDARSRHLIRAIQMADLPSILTQRLVVVVNIAPKHFIRLSSVFVNEK